MNAEQIEEQIPAIDLLSDERVRKSVIATWADALSRSVYGQLGDAPQSTSLPGRILLDHVNETNRLALGLIEVARNNFAIEPRFDIVLSAVILHDVDKLLIYRRLPDRSVGYSSGMSAKDHGPVGADIAAAHDVPGEVCDLVRYHSPFAVGGRLPGNIEGTIVHYADLTATDFASVQAGAIPFHERTHAVRNDDGEGSIFNRHPQGA